MAPVETIEHQFTAIEKYNLWPQARLHTQWPGAGVHGDQTFEQFRASQNSSMTDNAKMDAALPSRITKVTGIKATTTARGVVAAFRALGARKIVLVSPYTDAINAHETVFLAGRQIKVLSATGLGITEARDMAKVEPGEWYRLVRSNAVPEADAYFISCTAIRSLEAIEVLERDLGKPVVTSNQAAIWHSLRELGIADAVPGCGRLMTLAGGGDG